MKYGGFFLWWLTGLSLCISSAYSMTINCPGTLCDGVLIHANDASNPLSKSLNRVKALRLPEGIEMDKISGDAQVFGTGVDGYICPNCRRVYETSHPDVMAQINQLSMPSTSAPSPAAQVDRATGSQYRSPTAYGGPEGATGGRDFGQRVESLGQLPRKSIYKKFFDEGIEQQGDFVTTLSQSDSITGHVRQQSHPLPDVHIDHLQMMQQYPRASMQINKVSGPMATLLEDDGKHPFRTLNFERHELRSQFIKSAKAPPARMMLFNDAMVAQCYSSLFFALYLSELNSQGKVILESVRIQGQLVPVIEITPAMIDQFIQQNPPPTKHELISADSLFHRAALLARAMNSMTVHHILMSYNLDQSDSKGASRRTQETIESLQRLAEVEGAEPIPELVFMGLEMFCPLHASVQSCDYRLTKQMYDEVYKDNPMELKYRDLPLLVHIHNRNFRLLMTINGVVFVPRKTVDSFSHKWFGLEEMN